MNKTLAGVAICACSMIGLGSSAFAGEVTGSGKGGPNGDGTPGGIGNAASFCVFSGLQDFDGAGAQPGSVQNWGHIDEDEQFLEILESTGASEVTAIVDFGFGPFELTIGCNPHVGGE